jgi:hypothetical protein
VADSRHLLQALINMGAGSRCETLGNSPQNDATALSSRLLSGPLPTSIVMGVEVKHIRSAKRYKCGIDMS